MFGRLVGVVGGALRAPCRAESPEASSRAAAAAAASPRDPFLRPFAPRTSAPAVDPCPPIKNVPISASRSCRVSASSSSRPWTCTCVGSPRGGEGGAGARCAAICSCILRWPSRSASARLSGLVALSAVALVLASFLDFQAESALPVVQASRAHPARAFRLRIPARLTAPVRTFHEQTDATVVAENLGVVRGLPQLHRLGGGTVAVTVAVCQAYDADLMPL